MPLPKYGAREGLDARLEDWIDRMSRDKSFPWMGSGLIADLKTAVSVIRGVPEDEFADFETPTTCEVEFDL